MWTWKCHSITKRFKTDILCSDIQRKESVRDAELRSSAELLSELQKQKEENLAWHSRRPASRRLVRTPSAFLPAYRLFSHKEPFLRPRGSGKLFPPILRMEELCHWRSPKWLQEWCVTTTKMNDNLTQHFTGTRQGWYCWKRSQNMEHKMLRLFMREAARQGSRTARIPKIPWPTSEQFKDTLVEEQLTLSWFGTFSFLAVGKSIFSQGLLFSAFNLSLRTDWFRVERKATKGRQTVFFTPLNPSGGDSDEEEPRDDYTVPQKVQYHSHCWIKLSWAQDQGLQFWQTKSHAIIAHSPVPADLHLLISKTEIEYCPKDSQTLDSTPRPAPKVSLKSNLHSQQQQQSLCDDVSTGTRRLVRDSQSGRRDVRGYTTDDQTGTRRLVWDLEPAVEKKPQFEIDLRVEGVSQDAILQDEQKMKEINEQAQNPFVTICRKVKWSSVKNEVALSTRRATWSWSNWDKPRRLFSVLLAWSTYQRDWTCVNAASGFDPIKVRWTESQQHLQRSKLLPTVPQ